MGQHLRVGAQLSTSHSLPSELSLERVVDVITRVSSILELDMLIVGAHENPEIFRAITDLRLHRAKEVYLWYNLALDDIAADPDGAVLSLAVAIRDLERVDVDDEQARAVSHGIAFPRARSRRGDGPFALVARTASCSRSTSGAAPRAHLLS